MKLPQLKIHQFIILCLLGLSSFNSSAQQFDDGVEMKLTPAQITAFKAQAINSVTDLSRHITVMVDKSNDLERRNKAVELAIKLFNSEENIVQVSSINRPEIRDIKIRSYFNKIKVLPYSSVKITWYEIYLSSDFKQGPDGKYYGVATIFQKFEGVYNNEVGTYKDITKKNIQVVVDKVNYFEGADKKEKWVLKLGDIKVEETKSE